MTPRCKKCQGGLDTINRMDKTVFLLCRACKLPHDEHGRAIFESTSLNSNFRPLRDARGTIKEGHPNASPVAKTALEVALIASLQEAYLQGLKDGVLLAYSQDYMEGGPYGTGRTEGVSTDPREGGGSG